MLDLFRLWLGAIKCLFSSRKNLLLENLALRQQLAVLKRKNKRPRLNALDRLFWVAVKSLWAGWSDCLLIVTPATVVGWHRAGFRLYWKLLSKARVAPGRKRIGKEMRDLIFRMVAENPTWGAPRIHGELLKLGSIFPSALFPVGLRERRAARNRQDAGKRFFTIITKPLPQWIFSLFQRSHSEFSIVSSSSDMTAVAFCTSASPGTQPVVGWRNSCEKHFLTITGSNI